MYKRVLLGVIGVVVLFDAANAKEPGSKSKQIEGSWVVTVNLKNPSLPPFFEALETYSRGGGLITSNAMAFLTRVGQGSWERSGNQYVVRILFFKFDQTGLPAGTIKVSHTITLNGGNEYEGSGTAELCEADGVTCLSTDFSSFGRRLSIEP